jgi:DNA end-binding protein Ku
MARPIWRGRLALVACLVAPYNARHDRAGIRFNLINPETGNRIRMITQDAERSGPRQNDDFDSVKIESSSVITMRSSSIRNPSIRSTMMRLAIWHRMSMPGAICMPCSGRQSPRLGKTAVARVVISQREHTIAIRPTGDGLGRARQGASGGG